MTGEGHCYQSHILFLSLHQSSLSLCLNRLAGVWSYETSALLFLSLCFSLSFFFFWMPGIAYTRETLNFPRCDLRGEVHVTDSSPTSYSLEANQHPSFFFLRNSPLICLKYPGSWLPRVIGVSEWVKERWIVEKVEKCYISAAHLPKEWLLQKSQGIKSGTLPKMFTRVQGCWIQCLGLKLSSGQIQVGWLLTV